MSVYSVNLRSLLRYAQGLHPIRSAQVHSVVAERLVLSDLSLTSWMSAIHPCLPDLPPVCAFTLQPPSFAMLYTLYRTKVLDWATMSSPFDHDHLLSHSPPRLHQSGVALGDAADTCPESVMAIIVDILGLRCGSREVSERSTFSSFIPAS